MDNLSLINNTSVYRNPAPQSPLQGQNVMQPAVVYSKIMLRTIELAESDYVFDGFICCLMVIIVRDSGHYQSL